MSRTPFLRSRGMVVLVVAGIVLACLGLAVPLLSTWRVSGDEHARGLLFGHPELDLQQYQALQPRLGGWVTIRTWPSLLQGRRVLHGEYEFFWDGDPAKPWRRGLYIDGSEVRLTKWSLDGEILFQVDGNHVTLDPPWLWGQSDWE